MIYQIINQTLYQSEHYRVKQNWFYRWLEQPDGTIHSRINRFSPHKPALDYMRPMVQLCNEYDGTYLMLGLGGGAILRSLAHKLKQPTFDVVEINPEIIAIARQFFCISDINSTTIYQQDAKAYVENCGALYDVIIIDLYQTNAYPQHCADAAFFKACQRLLKPKGLVAINCANMAQYSSLLNQLRHVFEGSVLTIRIKHPRNVILVAGNQSMHSIIDNLPLQQLNWHDDTGAVGKL